MHPRGRKEETRHSSHTDKNMNKDSFKPYSHSKTTQRPKSFDTRCLYLDYIQGEAGNHKGYHNNKCLNNIKNLKPFAAR